MSLVSSALAHPNVSFSLLDFEKRHRADAWRNFNEGLFEVGILDDVGLDLDARATGYSIGSCVVGRFSISGNTVRRIPPRLSLDRRELLVMRLHIGGFTKGVMGNAGFEMKKSGLTFFDFDQHIQGRTERVDYISLTVPYAAVGYDPSKQLRLFQISEEMPAGKLLAINLRSIFDMLPTAPVNDINLLTWGLCGLIRGILIGDFKDEGLRTHAQRGRDFAIRQHIESNLLLPSLNSQSISQALGVSIATVQRLFSEHGGANRFIARRRAEMVFEELSKSEAESGLIRQIAKKWCFYNQAQFSRLFRQEFGVRPTDVLGADLVRRSKPRPSSKGFPSRSQQIASPLAALYRKPFQTIC